MATLRYCATPGYEWQALHGSFCPSCATETEPRERLTFIDWDAPDCD